MAVKNHLLFSEIFFQQIRRETADLGNLRATLSTIQDTWQYYLPPPKEWQGAWTPARLLQTDDVAQLRAKVVEQIFAYLELTYDPCPSDDRAFFLYGDWAREDRTGLCLVLPYSADIEGRDPKTGFIPKGRNYAQQLIRLLRQHNLDWGVLTNGRHWRLYHRTELSPTDTYLHIDLERIIAANDIQNYIVFHRFFSRPAFARQDGRQRLDLYKQQSDEATRVIEKHLSAHVEEIVRHLCQGMVESCRAAGEDVTASETRTDIYKNALFLVYRLLFVLYAEARDLLPLEAPAYRRVCLHDLLAQVRDNHRHGLRYDDDHALWGRLQSLFALIDQGNVAAGVPAYNGGLFDPERRPFLTHHHIRNEYLQEALIRLSTMPAKGKTYDQDRDPQPIDYRDLSVRHLGSLYEGLLEYNLFVVQGEERVVRVAEKKTEYVPRSQAGTVRASETLLQIGDVYFSETAGERKATGSYYTPEDVVDYIVRHTVSTKLTTLKADFYATQGIERQLADLADTPSSIPAHRQIRQALDDQFLRFVREKVLALKILDPAMGSGHFLVNATHAVANFIAEVLNETAWDNSEIDTDVATWKRQVAERCIFGVDLNELAVELAKLCLWMTTAAKGKPLTFLDHHLRWGNSLVGAWLKDVGVYPLAKKESKQVFTLPLERFQVQLDQALAGYRELYAKNSDQVEEVREKARIYDEKVEQTLRPYRELFDLHTGIYFGSSLDEATYAKLGAIADSPTVWKHLREQELRDLLEQHARNHWFHWELEFPEIFFRLHRGFDVVFGNPPYVELSQPEYQANLPKTHRCGNTFAYFFEVAIEVARSGGQYSYIVPIAAVSTSRMQPLQELLLEHSSSVSAASFAVRPSKIFPDADMNTSIVIGTIGKTARCQVLATGYIRWYDHERSGLLDRLKYVDVTDFVRPGRLPKVGSPLELSILSKMLAVRRRLGDFQDATQDVPIYYHSGGRYWRKALLEKLSSHYKPIYIMAEHLWPALCALNSTLFYWYWLAFSNCYDLVSRDVVEFPIDFNVIQDAQRQRFEHLGQALLEDYEKHVCITERTKNGKTFTQKEYQVSLSKPIIDMIDRELGAFYGFDDTEVEFLIGFDAKYRGLESD